jgi:hypothetical protein
MGRQWKDSAEVDGASAAGAAGAAGTTGGNAADPGEMEVEEAEAGPDDERVEAQQQAVIHQAAVTRAVLVVILVVMAMNGCQGHERGGAVRWSGFRSS